MSFPAPSTPTKQWLYVSDAVTTYLGDNATVNWNQVGVDKLLCYAYAQGYTGLFLYQIDNHASFYTGGAFTSAGKAKLADFIQRAYAKGISVGVASNTNPTFLNAVVDYNNNYASGIEQKITAIPTENEFWSYSFNKTAQQAGTGTYSFLTMKSNLLSRKVALNASGCYIYGYLGWTKANNYVYSTPYNILFVDQGARKFTIAGNHTAEMVAGYALAVAGSSGNNGIYTILSSAFVIGNTEITVSQVVPSAIANGTLGSDVVTGGTEIQLLNGVIDYFMLHCYFSVPTYNYVISRTREINFPANVLWIFSAESDQVNATGGFDTNSNFEGHYFKGEQPVSPYAQLYTKKNIVDAYKYVTIDTNALGYTPTQASGTPRYFNAETNPATVANVSIVGCTVFSTRFVFPSSSPVLIGDGPRIYVNAGNDITTSTVPGTVGFNGVVCDDGLPSGSVLTYNWAQVSGPTGVFSPATNILNPDFDFSSNGTYILRLTVTDGTTTSYDEVTIFANAVPTTKTIIVESQNPFSGVTITVDQVDINGDQDGVTQFTRYYNSADNPTFTAPATVGLNVFSRWQLDGADYSFTADATILDSSDHTLTAIYAPPVSSGATWMLIVSTNIDNPYANISPVDILGYGGLRSATRVLYYYDGTTVTISPNVGLTPFVKWLRNGVDFAGNTNLSQTFVMTADVEYTMVWDINDYAGAGDTTFETRKDITRPACADGIWNVQVVPLSAGTYTYLWSIDGSTADNISHVAPFASYVTVTETTPLYDVSVQTQWIAITALPAMSLQFTVVDAQCGTPNGQIKVTAIGGVSPYTYLWSNGETSDTLTDAPGAYTVVVTDAGGCSVGGGDSIAASSNVSITSSTEQDITCNGANNGTISVTTVGGNLPLTFHWSKVGFPLLTFPNSNSIIGLSAGTYHLYVEDASGCTTTVYSFAVAEPGPISFDITLVSGSFCSNNNITLQVTNLINAIAPVTYRWSDGSTAQTLNLGVLPAGNYVYSCTVTGVNACTGTVIFPFTVSAAPSSVPVVSVITQPSFCTGTSYQLSVSGTGSFASFEWVPTGDTTTTITHLSNTITAPTDFYVIAYDAFGCSIESNHITVNPANNVIITVVAVVDNACAGSTTSGSIDIAVTGGCPGYTFAWTGPGGFTATTQNISGLIIGNYTVVVTDTQGNTNTDTIQVGVSSPTITGVVTNAGCPGTSTGGIDVTVSGGTPPYSYAWSNGATTQDLSNLSVGAYTLLVTDDNGCTDTNTFIISSSGSPVLLSFQYTNPTEGNTDGVVSVTATGGVGPYTYLWSTGDTTPLINNLPPGTYTVTVTDSNNCSAIGSVNLFDNIQEEIEALNCCAGQMGYKYVWQMENGLEDKAECTIHNLILLHGYISDLCNYVSGTCLTSDQIQSIIQKAKQICGCCDCGSDMYDDTILN